MIHLKGYTFSCKCFIKGKWYECDNYWVSERFYEKNKEPYWFYDSCSPSEYEGEDKE